MKIELQKTGWGLDKHGLSDENMNLLIQKKEKYLQISSAEVQKEFGVTFTAFENEKVEYIELAKAITRSLLRYDVTSIELTKSIYKKLKSSLGLTDVLNYCTIPYPIIHFPFDTSELGSKHKDGYNYIKHFYTTWTPLNDCFDQPVAIVENTHKNVNRVVQRLRYEFKFIATAIDATKKTVKPDLRIGEFLTWYGTTDHEGMLNKSHDVRVALVVRFTSSPIMLDGTLNTSDLEQLTMDQTATDTNELVKKFIRIFKEVRQQAEQSSNESTSFESLVLSVEQHIKKWNLNSIELKQVSFMLTLWAQRMESKKDVFLYNLYAINCSPISLIALDKCITALFNRSEIKSVQELINITNKKQFSVQAQTTIKNVLEKYHVKAREIDFHFDSNAPLLKW